MRLTRKQWPLGSPAMLQPTRPPPLPWIAHAPNRFLSGSTLPHLPQLSRAGLCSSTLNKVATLLPRCSVTLRASALSLGMGDDRMTESYANANPKYKHSPTSDPTISSSLGGCSGPGLTTVFDARTCLNTTITGTSPTYHHAVNTLYDTSSITSTLGGPSETSIVSSPSPSMQAR